MKHCLVAFRVWKEFLRGEASNLAFWCSLNYSWMFDHNEQETRIIAAEYHKQRKLILSEKNNE